MNILDFLKSQGLDEQGYKDVLGIKNSSISPDPNNIDDILALSDPNLPDPISTGFVKADPSVNAYPEYLDQLRKARSISTEPSKSISVNEEVPRMVQSSESKPEVVNQSLKRNIGSEISSPQKEIRPLEKPVLDQGYEIGTREEYEKALAKVKEDQLYSRLAERGSKLGSALTGLIGKTEGPKVDEEEYARQRSESAAPLKELETKIKLQDTDPKSAKSTAYRDYLKKLGFPVSENASYATLKDLIPEASKSFDREMERQFKKEENSLRREELNQRQSENKQIKSEDKQNKWIDRVTPQISKLSQGLDQAQIAKEIASRAKIGSASELSLLYKYVKSLDDNTAVREGEIKLAEALSSMAGRLDFQIKKIGSTGILPQRTFDLIKKEILELAKGVEDTYNRKVSVYHNQAKSYGLNEEDFKRFDPYYEQSKNQNKKDPKIQEYAKQYNITYEKAESILKSRGYEGK